MLTPSRPNLRLVIHRVAPALLPTSTGVFGVDWITDILAMEVLRGMREAASRGFWVAPMAPYGYKKVKVLDGPKERPTLEPDPETTGVVKRIFDLAETRKGMMKIVRILNDEGIASPRGKLWNKPTVPQHPQKRGVLGHPRLGQQRQGRGRPGAGGKRRSPPPSPRPSPTG